MYDLSELLQPKTLDEALSQLREGVWPLAGGTDLLVRMRRDKTRNARLMSLANLDELKGIQRLANGDVALGACTTFTQLAENPIIAEYLPMLKAASLVMGGPQIRNVATVGGNLCNGAVGADSAPPLLALDARLELQSAAGTRKVRVTDFHAGPGKVHKRPDELLVRIVLPVGGLGRWGGVYIKASTRKAMDIATLGVAAVCSLDAGGAIVSAALALGAAAPTPVRCPGAEAMLRGRNPTEALLDAAGVEALKDASPRSSWRASREYRQTLIKNLTARALGQAVLQAGGSL